MSSDRNPMRLLVAGAASGIGRATAGHELAAGADVAVLDRDEAGLRSLAEESARYPGSLRTFVVDASDAKSLREAADRAVAQLGGVDALVNTVGIAPDAGTPVVDLDPELFDFVCGVNLRSALVLSQAVLPAMAAQSYGRIVHVASIAGKEGNPRMATYSASKAGLIGLTKSMGREYAQSGVVINCLAPAVIRTPMLDDTPSEVVDMMLSRIPMGRAGELDEVAALISWMISPLCSFTTGFAFDLSGGRATY
jgi:2-dehydro-3-deoxy-L-rhamnonate dehydrogenase (NAD+)